MTDLQAQIEQSIKLLQSLESRIAARISTIIPTKCYEYWGEFAANHHVLSGAAELFETRHLALEELRNLVSQYTEEPEQRLSFAQSRYLRLMAYMTTSWAIYDRLASACGKLLAPNYFGEKNPKLHTDFLSPPSKEASDARQRRGNRGSVLAFTAWRVLEEAYAWPLLVSYTIRNWLVHEGDAFGSTPIFHGKMPESGFLLSNKAASRVQEECQHSTDNEGHPGRCCLKERDPWKQPVDILETLVEYHGEIDRMFLGLVKWSVDSFVGQFNAFTARDGLPSTPGRSSDAAPLEGDVSD